MALKTTQVTYEYALDEIQALIAKELNLPKDDVSVEYVITETGDERWASTYKKVTSIRVTTKTK